MSTSVLLKLLLREQNAPTMGKGSDILQFWMCIFSDRLNAENCVELFGYNKY
jgi:hypothetical protein